ncbi:MAG: hypothetical protein LBU34_07080 [Planctomycetaceae bacterium]|jgi:hypothetical protein|nr:hypothetical protein [Planctomycetaceae bacterium]
MNLILNLYHSLSYGFEFTWDIYRTISRLVEHARDQEEALKESRKVIRENKKTLKEKDKALEEQNKLIKELKEQLAKNQR